MSWLECFGISCKQTDKNLFVCRKFQNILDYLHCMAFGVFWVEEFLENIMLELGFQDK